METQADTAQGRVSPLRRNLLLVAFYLVIMVVIAGAYA
jgi:hypothetical protein